MIPILFLVLFGSISCHVSVSSQTSNEKNENFEFLATEQTKLFETAFRDAFKERGIDGVRIYFTDDFKALSPEGGVFGKDAYLKHLAQPENGDHFVFVPNRQSYFDFVSKNLFVSFYEEHILFIYTLEPNRALLGGYQIKKLEMAPK